MLTNAALNLIAAGFVALAAIGGCDRVVEGSVDLAVFVQRGRPRISVPASAKLWLNGNALIFEDTRKPRKLNGNGAAHTLFESSSRLPPAQSTTQALFTGVIGAKVPVYLFESVLNL